jgi:hypothetical protein
VKQQQTNLQVTHKATKYKEVSLAPGEEPQKNVGLKPSPKFHTEVVEYCAANQIKIPQLIMLALTRTMANGQPIK